MESPAKSRLNIKDMTLTAVCVAIIAVCTWIHVPLTIPVTLQTFAVFFTSGLLGRKRGVLAVVIYLLLGVVGIPVFSGFRSGFGALLGITGGYMIGFIFIALIVGYAADRLGRRVPVLIVSMILGLLACYAFGTVWYMVAYAGESGLAGLASALTLCVLPFIVPDAVKIGVAVVLIRRLERYI